MFPDYISLVVQDYQRKRFANVLPLSLMRPSPARIKAECLAVCKERFDRRDEKALKAFFGDSRDKVACLQAIERCDIDKFRPLVNFLKETTTATEDKNIELLAWLIDFSQRPWEIGKEYCIDVPEGSVPGAAPAAGEGIVLVQKRRNIRRWLPLLVLVGVGMLMWWLYGVLRGAGSCMVWAGEHYRPVGCELRFGDTPVIPLDSDKLVHFKKITRQDTISEDALGHVWYAKYNGVYECYTSPGNHPIDSSLRLRLLTDFVLINHIRADRDPEKGGK
jgi:hypothetical protein